MFTWLKPPVFEDEYTQFAYSVLHYTLLLFIAALLVYIPFAEAMAQLLFVPGAIALFGLCLWLLRRGWYNTVSLLFVIGLWNIIAIASLSTNGIRNASLVAFVSVIIFSAILFSRRAVLVTTGLSILHIIVLAVGETMGILPLTTTPLYIADRGFQLIAGYGAAGILLAAAAGVVRKSHETVKANEQMLQQSNLKLQAEIEQRIRVEESLRASEETYRLLFENIPVMCAVVDEEHRLVLINKTGVEHSGIDANTRDNGTLHDLYHPDSAQEITDHLQQNRSGDQNASTVEGTFTFANGKVIYGLQQLVSLPRVSAQAPNTLIITTDLTQQKKAAQRENELALAKEKNTFLQDFLGTVSHDLKTPITTIKTSLYLLRKTLSVENQLQRLAQIDAQASLLNRYIQDMLTIARLQHMPDLDRRPVDLNPLLEAILQRLQPRIEEKRIRITQDAPAHLPTITADPDQLERVILNLIENAINYTPSDGQVSLATRFDESRVYFSIKDTGIGIDEGDIANIFDRFYRTQQARAFSQTGTGLGLAIVKRIVEIHDGDISISSKPGHGTEVNVQLPV